MMRAVTLVPSATFRLVAERMRGRFHLICSNVPGPPLARYLAGAKVDSVYPFAPIMLEVPLSIALLSYGKTLCVGIDCDPAAIPDPQRIRELLEAEIDHLERIALRFATARPRKQGRRIAARAQQRTPQRPRPSMRAQHNPSAH